MESENPAPHIAGGETEAQRGCRGHAAAAPALSRNVDGGQAPTRTALLCMCAQSCPTLRDPVDCSPPGSSVHGILQARALEQSCHALLQGIFPTRGLNPGLLYCRRILDQLSHQGIPPSVLGLLGTFKNIRSQMESNQDSVF